MFSAILDTVDIGLSWLMDGPLLWFVALVTLPAWAPLWAIGYLVTKYKTTTGSGRG